MAKRRRVLRYLSDFVSGRLLRWIRTNNPVINKYWARVETLPEPISIIFKEFLVAAGITIEAVFGVGRPPKSTLTAGSKRISAEQLEQVYTVLVTYCCFLFSTTNRFLETDLLHGLRIVSAQSDSVSRTWSAQATVTKFDMGVFGGKVWEHVVEITEFDSKDSLGWLVYFSLTLSTAYVEAAKHITAKLSQPIDVA